MSKAGKFNLYVRLYPCVFEEKGANAEEAPTWPEPAAGVGFYFAAEDELSAGETIAQGVRQSTGAKKLRIRGSSITVAATDRLMVVESEELFEVTGVSRDIAAGETRLNVERAQRETVGQ